MQPGKEKMRSLTFSEASKKPDISAFSPLRGDYLTTLSINIIKPNNKNNGSKIFE
ncbi:MAG: hypothetical protein AB1589_15425 [Cyanobacteriota bacterium]